VIALEHAQLFVGEAELVAPAVQGVDPGFVPDQVLTVGMKYNTKTPNRAIPSSSAACCISISSRYWRHSGVVRGCRSGSVM